MYAVLPYAIATGVVEIPYLLAQTLLFAPVVYFMEGFRVEAEPFFLFVIVFMEVHCAFLQPYVLSWKSACNSVLHACFQCSHLHACIPPARTGDLHS